MKIEQIQQLSCLEFNFVKLGNRHTIFIEIIKSFQAILKSVDFQLRVQV